MRKFLVLLLLVFPAVPGFSQTLMTGGIGPDAPILVDTNGNGTADGGDARIVPTRYATTLISAPTPWVSSTTGPNLYFMQNPDSFGRYTSYERNCGAEVQTMSIQGYASNGTPNSFRLDAINSFYGTNRTGTGQLLDSNNDGIFDGVQGSGSGIAFSLPFVQVDTNGDGLGDHISIPWAQASLVGVDFNDGPAVAGAGGSDPQVWIPLADTNGDGRPDGIVLDLDSNGIPDPGTFVSTGFGPIAAPASIQPGSAPTLSEWGALLTILLLAAAGWVHLNRTAGLRARF